MNLPMLSITKIILIVAGALVLVAFVFTRWMARRVKRKHQELVLRKFKTMESMLQRLSSGEDVSADETLALASDPALRNAVFKSLDVYGRRDLFPDEYFTHEKGAESFLVEWLEFPTELDKAPDEIEFVTKVTVMAPDVVDYFVFQYRTYAPHWAARYQWMLGVAGPYQTNSGPYDVPVKVFSRFNAVDTITPEAEVAWVHEHVNLP
ncbi:hypothetical protein [Chryseolinea lacunae]|uniref:Uncharacterized protein n=1 Tax=Chryseolinea lacunae TaxID=2801331 RepID=A0ABS1KZX4_9BACT|nr:hypothetical protein [Chryseolinea lacunae]MBL0744792.1 hypothetical protein [Chryseolinea lacunae]